MVKILKKIRNNFIILFRTILYVAINIAHSPCMVKTFFLKKKKRKEKKVDLDLTWRLNVIINEMHFNLNSFGPTSLKTSTYL